MDSGIHPIGSSNQASPLTGSSTTQPPSDQSERVAGVANRVVAIGWSEDPSSLSRRREVADGGDAAPDPDSTARPSIGSASSVIHQPSSGQSQLWESVGVAASQETFQPFHLPSGGISYGGSF